MTRKEAREFVMQTIFSIDAQKDTVNPDIEKYVSQKNLGNQKEYVVAVISNLFNNLEAIDNEINEKSEGWPTRRMGKTDLAIIRLAVTEIKFLDDVPKTVAINEAVELAKVYGTDDSSKFINAVLAKF